MIGIAVLVILVVIAVVLIGMYNSLVQLRVRCDSAWSLMCSSNGGTI
jgi:hypothetical protein